VERAIDVTVLGAIPPTSGDKPSHSGEKRRQLVPAKLANSK
jgi:hypothetical protein